MWNRLDTTGPGTHLLPRPAGIELGILYPRRGGGGNDNNGNNNFDSGFNGNADGGSSNGNGPLDRPSGNGPSDRPLHSNDNDDIGTYGGSNNSENGNSIDDDDSSFGSAGNAGNENSNGMVNFIAFEYIFNLTSKSNFILKMAIAMADRIMIKRIPTFQYVIDSAQR